MSQAVTSPTLSVVVTLVSGQRDDLARCLQSLRDQIDPPSLEIIVPYDEPCRDVTDLVEILPDVRFIRADGLDFALARARCSHEPFDVLRTVGLKAARATYVGLTEDHATLSPRWCRSLVELMNEHTQVGAVGAAIACGSDRLLNRAIYYCDFGRYQNPLPEGPARFVSDCNVVYRAQALDEVRDVWDERFREFPVHGALVERGWPIWLTPRSTAWQNRGEMSLLQALRERYIWGRAFGGIRFEGATIRRRLTYACVSPALPVILTYRLARKALSQRNHLGAFLAALPHIVLLTSAWACGEFVGYTSGRPSGTSRASRVAALQ